MSNPYESVTQNDQKHRASPKWRRRFLILNATLFVIPALLWIAIWGVTSLLNRLQTDPTTSDPIIYEHVVQVDINYFAVAIYILVPNLILAIVLAANRIRGVWSGTLT